jgi:hypothetical protein
MSNWGAEKRITNIEPAHAEGYGGRHPTLNAEEGARSRKRGAGNGDWEDE